jgi:hypothetical protein
VLLVETVSWSPLTVVLVPALALYWRAVRHHGREPELVAAADAERAGTARA